MNTQKEYRLLRPLPNKVVGQKVREDDLAYILNMDNHTVVPLMEAGWIEEWKEPKPKAYHINNRRYIFQDAKISISIEHTDKDYITELFKYIETSIQFHPKMSLTRVDVIR